MQIVIDIPDEMYDWLENGFPDEDDAEKLWQIVKNGTLLPKGHGRLIDADEFEKLADKRFEHITSPLLDHIQVRDVYYLLEATSTIIEKGA